MAYECKGLNTYSSVTITIELMTKKGNYLNEIKHDSDSKKLLKSY